MEELLDPWLLAETLTPLQVGNLENRNISEGLKEIYKRGKKLPGHNTPGPSAFPLQFSSFKEPGVENALPV